LTLCRHRRETDNRGVKIHLEGVELNPQKERNKLLARFLLFLPTNNSESKKNQLTNTQNVEEKQGEENNF
jgi:hypothetical protein